MEQNKRPDGQVNIPQRRRVRSAGPYYKAAHGRVGLAERQSRASGKNKRSSEPSSGGPEGQQARGFDGEIGARRVSVSERSTERSHTNVQSSQ